MSALWGRLAKIPRTEHPPHVGVRAGFGDAGLATFISHIPPAIDQSRKSQLRTQGVGDTVWQAELVAIALMNGILAWHGATQSDPWDLAMHTRLVRTVCAATHKAVPRAHIGEEEEHLWSSSLFMNKLWILSAGTATH